MFKPGQFVGYDADGNQVGIDPPRQPVGKKWDTQAAEVAAIAHPHNTRAALALARLIRGMCEQAYEQGRRDGSRK